MGISHVVVGTGGTGSQYLSSKYPNVEGTTLGTTKLEGEESHLTTNTSLTPESEKVGF